jgi:hypothetical protein
MKFLMTAAVAVVAVASSVSGAFAVGAGDHPTTYKGTRADLRVLCAHLEGERTDTHRSTRCDVMARGVTYICQNGGLCYIRAYSPPEYGYNGQSLVEDDGSEHEIVDGGIIIF